jgi:hypothetical protein
MRRTSAVFASRVAVALLLAAATTGCAGDDEPAEPGGEPTTASPSVSPTPDGPIEFGLRQYRSDVALRRVQIVVTNHGTQPIHVVDVQLQSPGYALVKPTRHDADLDPGRTVDLPVILGQPQCARTPTQSTGTVVVAANVRTGTAPPQAVRLPLPTPEILLDQLLNDECALLMVRDAVTVTFGPFQPTDKPAVWKSTVELRRRTATEKVTLEKLGSSVIIEVKAQTKDEPLAEMAKDEDTASVPVQVSTQRCDPHALGESKQTYILPTWVRIGDSDELYTPLQLDAAQLANLKRLIDNGCRDVPPLDPKP